MEYLKSKEKDNECGLHEKIDDMKDDFRTLNGHFMELKDEFETLNRHFIK